MASRTFLEQDSLQQGVLVPQHQTLIGSAAVVLLQGLQGVLIALDGGLELPNVLGTPLPKRGLGLPVPLLALFGGSVDLRQGPVVITEIVEIVTAGQRTGFRPPFLFCVWATS
jgi:hypothetical protein